MGKGPASYLHQALFQPLPSEPDVQLSPHPALQRPWRTRGRRLSVPILSVTPVSDLAFRNMRTSRLPASSHLFSFALQAAFPLSLAGRNSRDYYENSVTIGLAPLRRSRVPSPRNVLERRRLPTHTLSWAHCPSSIRQGVPRARLVRVVPDGVGVQTCYRRVCLSTTGYWGSSNPALALSLRRCKAASYTSSDDSCFANMLFSPPPFRFR